MRSQLISVNKNISVVTKFGCSSIRISPINRDDCAKTLPFCGLQFVGCSFFVTSLRGAPGTLQRPEALLRNNMEKGAINFLLRKRFASTRSLT